MDLRDQLQSTLGSAYTLERELGGGGMSRVFLAEELALGRRVVVKVLPSEMAAQVSLERFKREILLAAKLQHPHIVPLLSAGDANGLPYFTMPFVEGESLRARLARHGEFPVSDAIRILREIVAALAYAHERGIVHRDIKPDNVLLSGGSAMVTDFGVAKALSASSNADHGGVTSLGVALGTPAYMSPEQATADPAIDHRADVYAFGVLAYELLTGQPPFVGRTPQNLLAAHVGEVPESIARRRSNLPPALAALVMRCLEKRPADRPQSASEIVHVLDEITTPSGGTMPTSVVAPVAAVRGRSRVWWVVVGAAAVVVVAAGLWWRLHTRAGSAGGGVRSIAVLPFENTSGDSAYDYLADGMSDELRSQITKIARPAGITVMARSSSASFRGRNVNARDVGGKLQVGAVLQGAVSRSGTQLRVTAELVNTADGADLWSETFVTEAAALPVIQDSITRSIARTVRAELAPPRPVASSSRSSRGTTNIEAYDLFLRGRYYMDRANLPQAIESFQRAIATDRGFARAQASLAHAYMLLLNSGVGTPDSLMALANSLMQKALSVDTTLIEAYVARSLGLLNELRLTDALKSVESSIRIDSGSVDLIFLHGWALANLGRLDEALAEMRHAHELEPLAVEPLISLQYDSYAARRYRDALDATRLILDLDPKSGLGLLDLAGIYEFTGKPDSAVAIAEMGFKFEPNGWGGRANLVAAYAAAGRWTEARQQRTLVESEHRGNSPYFFRAQMDLYFSEFDAAMTALERAVEKREPGVAGLTLPCDPIFDPLKSDPRFKALIQRIGARMCPASGKWPFPKPPS